MAELIKKSDAVNVAMEIVEDMAESAIYLADLKDWATEKMDAIPSYCNWMFIDDTTKDSDGEVLCSDGFDNLILGFLCKDEDYNRWVCENDSCIMYDPVAYMKIPSIYI